MGVLTDIRDEVYLRINLAKTADSYLFNDFGLEKSWRPFKIYEEAVEDDPQGRVYVIGMASDDFVIARNNAATREVPVQIAYQKCGVVIDDLAAIDELVSFVEQLRDTCRLDVNLAGYSYQRNEYLKDENGIPYAFTGLRNKIFEAYFNAYYLYPLGD